MTENPGIGSGSEAPTPVGSEGLGRVEALASFGPKDFLVFDNDEQIDEAYRIGRLVLSDGSVTAVIAVAETEGKILVALPEAVWHRIPSKRRLSPKAISKPIFCSVTSCRDKRRGEPLDRQYDCKLWFGLLEKKLEKSVDYMSLDEIHHWFHEEEEDIVPFGKALVDVSQTHFSFVTAESSVPVCPPGAMQERLTSVEKALEGIQKSLAALVGEQKPNQDKPKVAAASTNAPARPSALRTSRGKPDAPPTVAGLDPETVRQALSSGVPLSHLQEVGSIITAKPKQLDELPRPGPKRAKKAGPLDETEHEEEEELIEDSDGGGLRNTGSPATMEEAVLALTAITTKLAAKEKKDPLEVLLDGSGSAAAGDSTSLSTSRKHSAAVRALQKSLQENPTYLYQVLESNLQSDFASRPIAPGEPMIAGTSVRGWLTARSRVQNYSTHVRWAWQVAGIWDCLIAGKIPEARARCGLLIAGADQASIDGGSWILSNVSMLESPPPFQAFAHHTVPGPAELHHSVLYDSRWMEAFMGYMKETESFLDAKKKLSTSKSSKETEDPKPKAKGKGKGDKPKKTKEGAAAESSQPSA